MRYFKQVQEGQTNSDAYRGTAIVGKVINLEEIPADCDEGNLPFKSWGHIKRCFSNVAFRDSVIHKVKIISESNLLNRVFGTYCGGMT